MRRPALIALLLVACSTPEQRAHREIRSRASTLTDRCAVDPAWRSNALVYEQCGALLTASAGGPGCAFPCVSDPRQVAEEAARLERVAGEEGLAGPWEGSDP